MKHLNRLSLSFTLVSILAVAAFAGETGTPSCAPGQIESPPCSGQSVTDGSTAPGQTEAPPASNAVDVIGIAEVTLSVLALF